MFSKTQALIRQFQTEGIFPGAVYQFITPTKKETQVLGVSQILPEKKQLTATMLFDVASLTKVICTTTVILKLMENGQFEVDQPLKNYLPEFQNSQITIRHLLTHTSDIQTFIANRDQLNAEELRAAYYQLEPGAELGRTVQYTDAGTILLGFMLEKLFQRPVIEIFQEEVLVPLKMNDSRFLPKNSEQIVPTENHPELGILKGLTHDPKARVLAEHAGNAGLFTNIFDLEKFTQMYLHFGQTPQGQFLQKATIENLLIDQTPEKTGRRSFGWDLRYQNKLGEPLLFHTGYTGTFLLMDIQTGSSFAFLSNRVHPVDHRGLYIEKRNQIVEQYLEELSQSMT